MVFKLTVTSDGHERCYHCKYDDWQCLVESKQPSAALASGPGTTEANESDNREEEHEISIGYIAAFGQGPTCFPYSRPVSIA